MLMAASQLFLEILLGWLFDSLEVLLDRLEWDCLARLGSASLRDDRLGDCSSLAWSELKAREDRFPCLRLRNFALWVLNPCLLLMGVSKAE